MNKEIKVLLLGLMTIGMVVGCDQKPTNSVSSANLSSSEINQSENSSFIPSSSSDNVSSSSEALSSSDSSSSGVPSKTDWTSEEAAIMSANLHGVVLPYNGLEKSVVTYDEKSETVLIQGGEMTSGGLATYKDKLLTMGFELTGSAAAAYGLEKSVQTAEGERFVYVYMNCGNNTFYLEANDPYYYSFPVDEMNVLATYYFTSKYAIPAFEANYYEINTNEMAIFGYGTTIDENAYSTILTSADWSVRSDKDSQGFCLADSPDKAYIAAYQYSANYKVLVVYLIPTDSWNENLIKAFFTKYNCDYYGIPAFETNNGSYQFVESYNNDYYYENEFYSYIHAFMYVYGATSLDLLTYGNTLTTAGWDVEFTSTTYIKATKVIGGLYAARIEVEYKEDKGYVEMIIYPALDDLPSKYWPGAKIALLLGDDVSDVIPEYTGENSGFNIINDIFGTAVSVSVAKGTENAGIALYRQILEDDGWKRYKEEKYDNRFFYISPHEEIVVEVYYGGSKYVTIDFKRAPYKTWPAAKIAKVLGEGVTDILPALDGAISYDVINTDGTTKIDVECNDVPNTGLAYYEILIDAGYTVAGTDRNNYIHLRSPNNQLDVCFFKWEETILRITVNVVE